MVRRPAEVALISENVGKAEPEAPQLAA
jgi:hypothetical protein